MQSESCHACGRPWTAPDEGAGPTNLCPDCRGSAGDTRSPDPTIRVATTLAPKGPAPLKPADPLHTLPGYQILEPLGRGGMGIVYKALDLRLGRPVALKVLHGDAQFDPEARDRFRHEAELLARLHHPNIVQVFEVGRLGESQSYFTMELIQGTNLEQRLGWAALAPRDAAGLLETLARAIAHAHQVGIIHRDLKPGNVLLEQDGTPKVTDFGLAKRVEHDSSLTQAGQILGTPAYMAPEQARGLQEVGPPADIYALGAILYHCLTGRPPFLAATPYETLDRCQNEDPVPPRRLQPKVPRDLETVCLKCLAKEPARRYGSAAELADDLRRFREGRAVLARPVGRAERLLKWARRRPAHAALLLVSVAAALAVLGVWAWADVQLRAALVQARTERARAERRSSQVREAAQDMYLQLAETWLAHEPHKDDVRRAFLLKARSLFEDLARDEGSAADLRLQSANASFMVGEFSRLLGETAQAEEAYRRAIAVQEQLRDEHPDEPAYRQALANSYNGRGELYRATQPAQAERWYAAAIALQQQLIDQFRATSVSRRELARSHYNRGIVRKVAGRSAEAADDYGRAIDLLRAQNPAAAEDHQELARAYLNRGNLRWKSPATADQARKDYEQALALLEALVGQKQGHVTYRYELAVAYHNRANLLADEEATRPRAVEDFGRAEALLTTLVRDHPSRPLFRAELANCLNSRAMVFHPPHGLAEAGPMLKAAREELARLVRDYPEARAYQNGLAKVVANQGLVALRRKDDEAAAKLLEESIGLARKAQGASRPAEASSEVIVNSSFNLALVRLRQGDHASAQKAIAQARDLSPHSEDHYYAARLLARCAAQAAADARLSADEQTRLRASYAREALECLRGMIKKGYKQWQQLRDEPAFRGLHGDSFTALVEQARRQADR